MANFPITVEDIFSKSNNGFEIFLEIFPQIKSVNQNFRIRDDDKHPSASLFERNGRFYVKDHGGAGFYNRSRNAIDAFMHEKGLVFVEALTELAKKYGIIAKESKDIKNFRAVNYSDFSGKLVDSQYEVVTKPFTEAELEILGPLVTPEVCERYQIFSVKEYSWVIALKENEDPNTPLEQRRIGTKWSTEIYPIYALIEKGKVTEKEVNGEIVKVHGKDFIKIMQPKDDTQRFRYFGHKPEGFVFGLEQFRNEPKPREKVEVKDGEGKPVTDEKGNIKYDLVEKAKFPRVFIGCGERDSLNIASLGAPVVWFNSETATISPITIKELFKHAEEVFYVPDMDETGTEQARKLALEYINVKICWLPKSLQKKTSWKNKPLKDFTDWIKSTFDKEDPDGIHEEFNALTSNSRPTKFWDVEYRFNKNSGRTTEDYTINHINVFHFLELNGYHKIVEGEDKSKEIYYVKQEGHILKRVSTDDLRAVFRDFVKLKRQKFGTREFPDALLNMLYSTEAISDKRLTGLDEKKYNLRKHGKDYQYLFFKDYAWRISKEKIEAGRVSDIVCYEENIINEVIKKTRESGKDISSLKIENDYFKIFKDKEGNWDVKISEKDCEFMNFLVDASRMYWKDEIAHFLNAKTLEYNKDEVLKWQKANQGILDGVKNEDETCAIDVDKIQQQKLHFINKIYTFGYLLHSYKQRSKAWLVYGMDNEVVEENKSFGRSGKSVFLDQALQILKNTFYIGARDPRVMDKEFLFNNVTESTEYILFDDADKKIDPKRFFTWVTGSFSANRKNKDPLDFSFFNSPKMALNTNFAPVDLDPSLLARLLFVSFSDWFHFKNEKFHDYSPVDQFGHEFFNGWDDKQWMKFLNFAAQCCKFFMATDEKIGAPESNIRKRNLVSEMGVLFKEWAEDFFTPERLAEDYIVKNEAYEDYVKDKNINKATFSAQKFKQKIEQFCEFNGYIFCPQELRNDKMNNRITKKINGKTEELIVIKTVESSNKTVSPSLSDLEDDDEMPY